MLECKDFYFNCKKSILPQYDQAKIFTELAKQEEFPLDNRPGGSFESFYQRGILVNFLQFVL